MIGVLGYMEKAIDSPDFLAARRKSTRNSAPGGEPGNFLAVGGKVEPKREGPDLNGMAVIIDRLLGR
ncbi:MAG: hypothetical protein JMM75_03090 [Candidatus Xiphinematobacter sp.]|nr:MAG: hypothetical protein JMM75_03090 [Candidatus Xiphinematobacter sp.]